ncbi:hypothetical protein IJZ97_05675, partial [bacterium]|nr:hypothetical protein [bacterium]
YQGKSIEEVLEAEAASGNQLAIQLAEELMTNVNLLIEIFKLADPNNKFMILMNLSEQELEAFLPLMEKEDLAQGLMYFTQEKLLKMLEEVPPEQLVRTVLEMFSKEEVIELMPEEQLDKLLTSHELDKNKVLEHLKSIPQEYLAQIIESVTGQICEEKNNLDMVKQIGNFNPLEYKEALTSLQPTQKQQLTLALVKENPELLQLFDPRAYTDMINQEKQKPEVVKAMAVLEEEEIIKMLGELPNDLMSIVITQIDTEVFADHLMKKHPELIAELIAA